MASLSETMMFSPLPRKVGLCVSPSSCSPSKDALQSLQAERPFWYNNVDDEAERDLHEALSGQPDDIKIKLPEWVPAFLPRSISKASTSAGRDWDNQLSPQCTTPVSVPATPSLLQSPQSAVSVPATPSLEADVQTQDAQGPRRNPSWLQVRKVFVGGIPQSMDQKEFYKMFSQVAKVKMAWLQMFHNDHAESRGPGGVRKHRGFGFVVFSEKHAVDQLLGEDLSRFLTFGDGLRLEVKRAVGKETVAATPDTTRAEGAAKGFQHTSPSTATTAASSHGYANTCSPMSPTMPYEAPTTFPYVPPFPTSWNSLDVQGPQRMNGNPSMPLPQTMPQQPMVAPQQPMVAPHSAAPQQMVATFVPFYIVPCPTGPALYDNYYNTLLDGFVGQKPRNKQELEYELLRATPDQYED